MKIFIFSEKLLTKRGNLYYNNQAECDDKAAFAVH